MAQIDPNLLDKIQSKLGVGQRRAYALINQKARETLLPPHLAAVALAADNGITISRFADADDLAVIRQGISGVRAPAAAQASAAVSRTPVRPTTKKPARAKATAKKKATKKPVKRQAAALRPKRKAKAAKATLRRTTVFVVHGRNEALRNSMFNFLRALGLRPLTWGKAVALTGKTNPFISEILDVLFREAAAVVVVFSPDDKAKLQKAFIKKNDPVWEGKLTGQARPNVLFEAGMAMGKNPDSTVLVQVGETRPFSDLSGKHMVQLTNEPATKLDLVQRLKNAGCDVDTSDDDYLTAVDFKLG